MFRVKTMSVEDFPFAVRLTDTMRWNLVEEDFEFMTRLEPDGCFILLDDSERVGIVTTVTFGKVGWLGNLIVSESHRKRGAGTLLVEHALKYMTNKNVETVGLYAYLDIIPFYKQLGFEYDSEFVVLNGKGFCSPTDTHVKEAGKEHTQEIINYDHFCFGASRRRLLELILRNSDNLCYIFIEDGGMLGYAMAKVYEGMAEVGPLICRPGRSDIAIDLLKATLNRLEGFEVSMCIPKKQFTLLNMLISHGFSEDFRVARMFRGSPTVKDCICMAESIERG